MDSTNKKPYSLEERTYEFARDCSFLVRDLKKRSKILKMENN